MPVHYDKRETPVIASDSGSSREPEYLQVLNDQQKAAVLECSAPLLVLAGAGSGKTRVITTKIVHLIETLHCSPYAILAVTFTNKAATEMKERVLGMTEGSEGVMVKTFHAFGAWLLRRYSDRLGLSDSFTIYDDEDSLTLLHSLYPQFKRTELKPYIRSISRAKDYCLSPDDDIDEINADSRFREMYAAYDRRLRKIGNADFGDLIFRSVELLRDNPDVRSQVQGRFRAILVDEYQDSNVAQYRLLKLLAGERTFICVVGDDDQSIYRFRGAELMNILTFPETFPGTKVIRLEENYRSTGNILKIAETVVSNNTGRHGKRLWTSKPDGERGNLHYFEDQFAEARFCADLVSRDHNYDGTAILYRTNAQSAAFETVFMRLKIPYKIIGALRFYDREEVKDALAILSLFMNPADEVAFRRIINKPVRGIGGVSLDRILAASADEGGSCISGLQAVGESLRGKARQGAADFLAWYKEAGKNLEGAHLADFTKEVLKNSGIIEYHRRQDEVAMTQKVNNLEQLVNAAGEYPSGREGLTQFLESLELDPTIIGKRDPSDIPGVTLITMHNTKGLEFERVIITGMEEGLFPGRANESEEDIEEERRIFYVSITRAQRQLHFTACRQRSIWGRSNYQTPSRFLRELPPECMNMQEQSQPGLRFSWAGQDSGSGPGSGYSASGYPSKRNTSNYRNSRGYHSNHENSSSKGGSNGYPGFGKKIPDAPGSSTESPGPNSGFSVGDRVYHDEYGSGFITGVKVDNGRETVDVAFDTGRKAKFIPKYARLEKIAHD